MHDKTELLTIDELNSLKKELHASYFTGIAIFFMIYLLTHLLHYANTDEWRIPKYELLIDFGFLFTTRLLTFIISRSLRKEIEVGTKLIEYKTIEDKHTYLDRQDRFSKEFTKHVIIANGKKYSVTEELYKKAVISDYLIVHKTAERAIELKLEILKTTGH